MSGEPGYCQCGCGQRTSIAKRNFHDKGIAKGQPMRFMPGHGGALRRTRDYEIDPSTGCWLWQGALHPKGYGHDRTGEKAHRVYYERHVGPIPDGLELDHICRNRACVNPEHLEAVTHTENIRRSSRTKLTWEIVREIRSSDAPRDELAERYGVGRGAIEQVIANANWHDPDYVPPSKRGGILRPKIAKLTPEDAIAIRASSLSETVLAARYGVCRASIGNVRRRVTFRYV
jgi:hypothetical protein